MTGIMSRPDLKAWSIFCLSLHVLDGKANGAGGLWRPGHHMAQLTSLCQCSSAQHRRCRRVLRCRSARPRSWCAFSRPCACSTNMTVFEPISSKCLWSLQGILSETRLWPTWLCYRNFHKSSFAREGHVWGSRFGAWSGWLCRAYNINSCRRNGRRNGDSITQDSLSEYQPICCMC